MKYFQHHRVFKWNYERILKVKMFLWGNHEQFTRCASYIYTHTCFQMLSYMSETERGTQYTEYTRIVDKCSNEMPQSCTYLQQLLLTTSSSSSLHLTALGSRSAPLLASCSPVARMNKWMKSRAGKTNPQLQSAGAEKNADLQILLTDFCHGEWLMTVSTIHMAVEAYVCVSHELRTWAVSLYIIKRLRNTRKHWSSSCLADNSLFFDESVSYWWLCCESVIWSQRGITFIPLLVSGT